MEKKTVIWISIGVGSAVLLLFAWVGTWLWMGTNGARTAAGEFAALLQAGDLDALRLHCDAYSVKESDLLRDEEGQVQVQTVTRQQMALKFGEELVGETAKEAGIFEEWDSSDSRTLEKTILSYNRILSYSVGIVWGDRAVMTMTLEGPDMDKWIQGLTDEELVEVFVSGEAYAEKLERRLAEGDIPMRVIRLQIPMEKLEGSWRFRMTEEMESAFLGAPYPAQ